jgi:hypothetical protein
MGQVSAQGGGYDRNVDPGPVNPPCIVEPSTLLTGGVPQVWIAASGGADWGGALVSVSFDGVNYDYIGTITSGAFQGVLTSNLSAATGLDTTDTLAIDLTQCVGIFPTAATNADATNLRTLCLVCPAYTVTSGSATVPNNGEMLAYGAVSATPPGPYTSDLTYLERGAYGTTGLAHSTGDFFTRLDLGEIDTPPNSIITYDLPPQYIGATIYVKLQSFNVFGNATEDISTVVEYIYTPSGTGYGGGTGGVPTTPTGLTGLAKGVTGSGWNSISWNSNPANDHVQYYTVLRSLTSGGTYTSIGTAAGTQFNDTTAVTGTTYYYQLTATNTAGTSSAAGPISVRTN